MDVLFYFLMFNIFKRVYCSCWLKMLVLLQRELINKDDSKNSFVLKTNLEQFCSVSHYIVKMNNDLTCLDLFKRWTEAYEMVTWPPIGTCHELQDWV